MELRSISDYAQRSLLVQLEIELVLDYMKSMSGPGMLIFKKI